MTMFKASDHSRFSRAHWATIQCDLAVLVCLILSTNSGAAATYRSGNFEVTASSLDVARRVAEIAEEHRLSFAREWLETEPSDWETVCQILVEQSASGGRGWVSVETYRGRVEKLRITLTGQLDRILEYVLPHEVAHASLAVSFAQPFPRWADEGIALLAESVSEKVRMQKTVAQLAQNEELLSLSDVLQLDDYPEDHQQLLGFYASTFSLTKYLISRGGKPSLMRFVEDGGRVGWEESARRHYDTDLHGLEASWRSQFDVGPSPTEQLADVGQVGPTPGLQETTGLSLSP